MGRSNEGSRNQTSRNDIPTRCSGQGAAEVSRYAIDLDKHWLKLIYGADEDADEQIIDWDELRISEDYENYVEGLYTRWMKPHHGDLRRQGCRIYTGNHAA